MTLKRFSYPTETLTLDLTHNSTRLPTGTTDLEVADEFYNRLAARFPVKWEPWSPAEPVIDTDDIPAAVSEADIETTLKNMKTDGVI